MWTAIAPLRCVTACAASRRYWYSKADRLRKRSSATFRKKPSRRLSTSIWDKHRLFNALHSTCEDPRILHPGVGVFIEGTPNQAGRSRLISKHLLQILPKKLC